MSSQEKIQERLFDCLDRLVPSGSWLRPDVDLIRELGLDSIKIMDVLMELEDEFDISIPLNILMDVRTPAQLAEAISSLMERADGIVR